MTIHIMMPKLGAHFTNFVCMLPIIDIYDTYTQIIIIESMYTNITPQASAHYMNQIFIHFPQDLFHITITKLEYD